MKIFIFLFVCYSTLSFGSQIVNVPSKDSPVIVTVTNDLPPIGINDDAKPLELFCGHTLSALNDYFNISLQLNKTADGQYGRYLHKNGTWTGMMGDIVTGKADIGVCLSITRSRLNYVDFSPFIISGDYKILYRKLQQTDWDDPFYLKPFTNTSWLGIIGISILMIFVMVLSNILTEKRIIKSVTHFTNDLFLFWPIVMPSQVNISSLPTSLKICVIVYLVFSTLILSVYGSLLYSFFAISKDKIPFNSLEEMLDNTDYATLTVKGWSVQEIISKFIKDDKFLEVDNLVQGIEMVYEKKVGFIIPHGLLEFLGKNCSFAFASRPVLTDIVTIAYSKQFQYKDYFNSKIVLLKEKGVMYQLMYRFFYNWQECKDSNLVYSVSLAQITEPMFLYVIGVLIAVIFWIFEIIALKIGG